MDYIQPDGSPVPAVLQTGPQFSVLLLDIDHYKQYNDSRGHDAGDLILVQLASILVQNTRDTDLACRYGGEGFVKATDDTLYRAKHNGRNRVEVFS